MATAVPSVGSTQPETVLHACSSRSAFTTHDVSRLTGATYRQLDYWPRADVVGPSIADADGSGSRRLWSYDDVVAAALVVTLLVAGQTLHSARQFVRHFRTDPTVGVLCERPWQSVTIPVDVADVRRVVDERLAAMVGVA